MLIFNHQASLLFGNAVHGILPYIDNLNKHNQLQAASLFKLRRIIRTSGREISRIHTKKSLHYGTLGATAQKDTLWAWQQILALTKSNKELIIEPRLPLLKKNALGKSNKHGDVTKVGLTPDILLSTSLYNWDIIDIKARTHSQDIEKLKPKSALYAMATLLYFYHKGYKDATKQRVNRVRWLYLNRETHVSKFIDVEITPQMLAEAAKNMQLSNHNELIPRATRSELRKKLTRA